MRPTKTKLILILLVLFCSMLLFAGCSKDIVLTEEQVAEISLTTEDLIAERDWANAHIEQLKIDYHEKEQELQDIHKQADELREYINDLNEAIYWNEETLPVMHRICELSPESPMCNDWEMLIDLKDVAEKRGTDYRLLLGIMYGESHIWANRKPKWSCKESNNWAWLKWRKYDDWTLSKKYSEQYADLTWQIKKDLDWCYLYYFEDVHQFFESLANTIWVWYAGCKWDVYCINRSYVWHESAAWVNNVFKFYSYN